MQWRFFNISWNADAVAQEEFNRFLRSVKVLCVHREFVHNGDKLSWVLAVEYLPQEQGKPRVGKETQDARVDYREQLYVEDFEMFVLLRNWRKELAREEGVPVYT